MSWRSFNIVKKSPLLFFVLILSLNMSSSNGFIRLFPVSILLYFILLPHHPYSEWSLIWGESKYRLLWASFIKTPFEVVVWAVFMGSGLLTVINLTKSSSLRNTMWNHILEGSEQITEKAPQCICSCFLMTCQQQLSCLIYLLIFTLTRVIMGP